MKLLNEEDMEIKLSKEEKTGKRYIMLNAFESPEGIRFWNAIDVDYLITEIKTKGCFLKKAENEENI